MLATTEYSALPEDVGLSPASRQPEPCFAHLRQGPRTGYWPEGNEIGIASSRGRQPGAAPLTYPRAYALGCSSLRDKPFALKAQSQFVVSRPQISPFSGPTAPPPPRPFGGLRLDRANSVARGAVTCFADKLHPLQNNAWARPRLVSSARNMKRPRAAGVDLSGPPAFLVKAFLPAFYTGIGRYRG
jgi:hypothetical protein